MLEYVEVAWLVLVALKLTSDVGKAMAYSRSKRRLSKTSRTMSMAELAPKESGIQCYFLSHRISKNVNGMAKVNSGGMMFVR